MRLSHTDRKVAFQDRKREWHEGDIARATGELRQWAQLETTVEIKRGKQVRPKKQPAQVELAACPLRLTSWTKVRRKGKGQLVTRELWLVQVRVLGTDWDPPVALAHRLARHRCAECPAHLYHVPPTVERAGPFHILENLPGLGRRATARSRGHPHLSRPGLARSGLSLQPGGQLRLG